MPLVKPVSRLTQPLSAELKRHAQRIGARLRQLPGRLGTHPGLLYSPGIEGYRDYTFGGRAGPQVHVQNVFHELAHAAQFGADAFSKRAKPEGFVFKVPQVYVAGGYYAEPTTCQGTMRELETFIYQWHLQQAAGMKGSLSRYLSYAVRVTNHMPDWYHVPGETERARHAHRLGVLKEKLDEITPAQALAQLEAWLDATAKALARKPKRSVHQVAYRFHTDGSLYDLPATA